MKSVAFALALMLAGPAMAQDLTPDMLDRIDAAEDIPRDEWQEMVRGRTVVYRIGLEVWAFESYPLRGNSVAIRLADGSCMEGTWDHIDNAYCFAWEDREYSCFRHARSDGSILVIPVVDGAPSGSVQTVSAISDAPLLCGPGLTS